MRNPQSLARLRDLSHYQEQLRSADLARALAEYRQANEQQRQLQQYLRDYQQRYPTGSLADLRNHREFILKLSRAIEEQNGVLARLEHRMKTCQQHWRISKKRHESVEQAYLDARQAMREAEEKALQKDLETHTARPSRDIFDNATD